jgi:ribosomal protein S18 acetylase RimI-like enzyme
VIVRALDPTCGDEAEIGRTLVVEYVEATIAESEAYGEPVPRALTRSLFPEAYDFAAVYGNNGFAYLVAESEGRVAGGVGLKPLDVSGDLDATCEMKRMWIRPEFRRRGAARALAVALLDHARHLGYREMVLDVVPQRTAAIALYRDLGFRECAPTHEYPFSMVFLSRRLAGP